MDTGKKNNKNTMKKKDIIDAYCEIRKTNTSIPDEVLDFMKQSAIEKLDSQKYEKNLF